jgi:probable rRNA maturation factor
MKLTITLYDSGIKNKASKVSTDLLFIIKSLESAFTHFLKKNAHFSGVKAVSISLTLCGKRKIQSLNQEFREKNYATDVLSFPIYENLRPDKLVKTKNLPELELGDLIICKEIARKQAKEFQITYEQEIIHLAVHGFLHLLGFDHEISKIEEQVMEKYENDLVKKIYKAL